MKRLAPLFFFITLVFLLLLLPGCAEKRPEKRVTLAKQKMETNTSLPAADAPPASENASAKVTNASLTNGEDIRVRRLSDEESSYLKRNTEEYETLREQKYGTRVDMTQVNAYNCRFVSDYLGQQLKALAIGVKWIDNELEEKEQEVVQAEAAYKAALASDNEFKIKTARFDYHDAQNEYDTIRKKSKQAHDDYDEIERTKRIVELKCTQMRKEAGLKD